MSTSTKSARRKARREARREARATGQPLTGELALDRGNEPMEWTETRRGYQARERWARWCARRGWRPMKPPAARIDRNGFTRCGCFVGTDPERIVWCPLHREAARLRRTLAGLQHALEQLADEGTERGDDRTARHFDMLAARARKAVRRTAAEATAADPIHGEAR